MKKRGIFNGLLALVLSLSMMLGTVTNYANVVRAEDTGSEPSEEVVPSSGSNKGVTWEKIENGKFVGLSLKNEDKLAFEETYVKEGKIRVSIVVDGQATLDRYANDKIGTAQALYYRSSLAAKQSAVTSRIEKEVLNGGKLDVVWNLTLAANIISAYVDVNDIDRIKAIEGVKDVAIENMYAPDDAKKSEGPNNSNATGMTGAQLLWAAGYTGAGSKVAIVDTGLDTDHRSFDAKAFDHAIEEVRADGKDIKLATASDIADVWSQLNASKFINSASSAYLSTKVPYAINYVDQDLEVTHDTDNQGEHGSHVAGIAAANRFVEKNGEFVNALEEVRTQGEAPDAQLYVMKVFGKGGGAYDSDYMSAIEDAIVLGCDSVNLSLGGAYPGFTVNTTYEAILNKLAKSALVWVNSAGNSYHWYQFATPGQAISGLTYPYLESGSWATGGSPATYANSLSVASVENDGVTGAYLKVGDDMIFYNETSGYSNKPITTLIGQEYDYIYIDCAGMSANPEEGGVSLIEPIADLVEGKVAAVNRGSSSFFAKGNVCVEAGAVATIIVNNTAGVINMNLTGYSYTNPCVSITLEDGGKLKANASETGSYTFTYPDDKETTINYYIGKISHAEDIASESYNSEYYTMSDFSSWGIPGDLTLKPEITAPGGNIYSVNGAVAGGQAYELMSGTSMAAPQVTGLIGVLAQYIRENDLLAKSGLTQRQLTNSLLMSTATPLIDGNSGSYYPVMQQGSGLVAIDKATSAKTFVMMDESATKSAKDGKIKVELGDDPDRNGKFTVTFTLNNLTDQDVTYELNGEFFTQDNFFYYAPSIPDAEGNIGITYSDYEDTMTVPLTADIVWTVNGEEYVPMEDMGALYDFDGDGDYDKDDAQYMLEYVVGLHDTINFEENADLDEDGDIDTHDAYLALNILNKGNAFVPADGSTTITADVTLKDIDKYDYYGAWIEGYLFATEEASEEGDAGVEHSIPVIGYYGSWTEPSMTDIGSYEEYLAGTEDRLSYTFVAHQQQNVQATLIQYPGESGYYLLGGNPMISDETYHPERDAISGDTMIYGRRHTQIRAAAEGKYTITDSSGKVLAEVSEEQMIPAFYHVNQARWYNTYYTMEVEYIPEDVKEGETLTMTLAFAPEYYLENGKVNWDKVGPGAFTSTSVRIDNTAPEIKDIEVTGDENGDITGITITAQDNQYISAIALYNEYEGDVYVYDAVGADEEAAEGAEMSIDFDISERYSEHLMVEIYDYAANCTTYKINLNEDELENEEVTVTVSPKEVNTFVNQKVTLKATVSPWGVKEDVTWKSEDESIATVDAKGVVTAKKVGSTTITATSVIDPEKSDSATITVFKINKKLNGVVWDENGSVWISEFDVGDLPDYTPLHGTALRDRLTAIAYGADGNLYGGTYDADTTMGDGVLYRIDPVTFETTALGGTQMVGFTDLAPFDDGVGNTMFTAFSTWMLKVDVTTGSIPGNGFDLSEYIGGESIIGLGYYFTMPYAGYNFSVYAVLTQSGGVYMIGISPENYLITFQEDGVPYFEFGMEADNTIWQSIYVGADEELYWAKYNFESSAEIIGTADEWGVVYQASFGKDVWPATGLFELQGEGGDAGNRFKGLTPEIRKIELETADLKPIREPSDHKVKGGLNSVTVFDNPHVLFDSEIIDADMPEEGENPNGMTVALTAVAEDGKATNGLYEVTWDPEKAELVSYSSEEAYNAFNVDTEAGKAVFGFISEEGVDNDEVVAELTFNSLDPETETEISISNKEVNSGEGSSQSYSLGNETYSVHVEVGEHGVADVADADVVNGESITITITPDEGYEIDVITVNGEEVKADKKGKLTIKINENTDVVISFRERTSPDTGDSSNLGLWVSLYGVSLIGAAYVMLTYRRRFQD
ncbi:MAG: S8 family serine peptidase [Erysipelotrichaceae bacterium]|nr:S8 family serine peptidase [Erysipelotrichaceae bacterium]